MQILCYIVLLCIAPTHCRPDMNAERRPHRKLAHAHLEIAAFAKKVSMLDSLAEDLVKARFANLATVEKMGSWRSGLQL